jgi:hypothetical protein
MKARIKYQDIVNYVLGTTSYHPLEFVLDPMRYEIRNSNIFDKKTHQCYQQEDEFFKFNMQVAGLKNLVNEMDSLQIQTFCRELERFSPLQINLN